MLVDELIEVTVTGNNQRWYMDKGYKIPLSIKQLYTTHKGVRQRNGVKRRVIRGTTIFVKPTDMPSGSDAQITFICEDCGDTGSTTFQAYSKKVTSKCNECSKLGPKGDGSKTYWKKRLIWDNPEAKCDISGETDKRFLVLHHLLCRKDGGRNELDNYVILSANYHMAFHNFMGGYGVLCTKEDYINFKNKENMNDVLEEKVVLSAIPFTPENIAKAIKEEFKDDACWKRRNFIVNGDIERISEDLEWNSNAIILVTNDFTWDELFKHLRIL